MALVPTFPHQMIVVGKVTESYLLQTRDTGTFLLTDTLKYQRDPLTSVSTVPPLYVEERSRSSKVSSNIINA